MIIKIIPIEINSEFANELLVEIHKHTMTESDCNVYYHLRDSNQKMMIGDKEIPYKILKWEILKVTGEDFEKIKENENYVVDYIINKFNLNVL